MLNPDILESNDHKSFMLGLSSIRVVFEHQILYPTGLVSVW